MAEQPNEDQTAGAMSRPAPNDHDPNCRPPADSARRVRARGISVFPLGPKGKHPLSDALPKGDDGKATWNPFRVEPMPDDDFERIAVDHPDANWAIIGGALSGLTIVDVDSSEGDEWVRARGWPEVDPPHVTTADGAHYYFQYEPVLSNAAPWPKNIDVKTEGGYVVAPGSIHPDGPIYTPSADFWEVEPPRMPSALLDALLEAQARVKPKASAKPVQEGASRPAGECAPYLEAAVNGERERLAAEGDGNRNGGLNRAAFRLGQLQHLGLRPEAAWSALTLACQSNGLWHDRENGGERKCQATFESGWKAGAAEPRQPEALPVFRFTNGTGEAPAPIGKWNGPDTLISARELVNLELPEPRYIVPGLIAEGLALLAARPKTGKSYLCLLIALAIAYGGRALGSIAVERGSVLYLALEDTRRRLQTRILDLAEGAVIPDELTIDTIEASNRWRMPDGLNQIRSWLAEHLDARLVIVDTLAKVRPAVSGGRNRDDYAEDYKLLTPLAELAHEYHVAIVVVTHTRKLGSDDWLDTVAGSTGLVGVADCIIGMAREARAVDASLHVTGRDVTDQEFGLKRNLETGGWTITDLKTAQRTPERQQVVDTITTAGPLKVKALGLAIGRSEGKPYNALRKLVSAMVRTGELTNRDGNYQLGPAVTAVTAVTRVTSDTAVTSNSLSEGVRTPDMDASAPPMGGHSGESSIGGNTVTAVTTGLDSPQVAPSTSASGGASSVTVSPDTSGNNRPEAVTTPAQTGNGHVPAGWTCGGCHQPVTGETCPRCKLPQPIAVRKRAAEAARRSAA